MIYVIFNGAAIGFGLILCILNIRTIIQIRKKLKQFKKLNDLEKKMDARDRNIEKMKNDINQISYQERNEEHKPDDDIVLQLTQLKMQMSKDQREKYDV